MMPQTMTYPIFNAFLQNQELAGSRMMCRQQRVS